MKPLVILVASISSVGHVNSCAGSTSGLRKRGHRVIFLLEEAFRGKVAHLGFEESIYQKSTAKSGDSENAGESLAQVLMTTGILGPGTAEEKMRRMDRLTAAILDEWIGEFNGAVVKAIQEYRPDLIWYDGGVLLPAIHYSGIPWICNLSMTPIFYQFDDQLPPGGSGLPFADRSGWANFNQIKKSLQGRKQVNDYFEALGYEPYPEDDPTFPQTQLLTVYATPDELNYPVIRQKDDWFNLEVFQPIIRALKEKAALPLEQLLPASFLSDTLEGTFSGKLIYLSMGSMGSIDLPLMKRLIEVLGRTHHKYIVSKGHLHEKYRLAPNMYGDRYLPQTALLPHVDLVITHGGNNTVTETFAEGKRMVVLPLFADQFDNAQRLDETGFGARIDYSFTEERLLEAVERMLNNTTIQGSLDYAAKRISSGNRHEELAIKVEELMKKQLMTRD